MNRRTTFIAKLLLIGFFAFTINGCNNEPKADQKAVPAEKASFVMYKNATCGCCAKWAEHMDASGYEVEEIAVENLNEIKVENGITQATASCHTAMVDGYIVEGHVPAEDVDRLLKERPEAIGITVPGMPIGSPGMEVEGRPADNYDVLLIAKDGSTSVWASH